MLVALTGNMGSGKSLVAKMFECLGIPVFNADIEAKKLYNQPEVLQQLEEAFGRTFKEDTGGFSPRQLADFAFGHADRLAVLSSIIHPYVIKQIADWYAVNSTAPYCIVESAIIFEHGLQQQFDAIITVHAPIDVRLKRVIQRDNTTEEAVRLRMQHQLSDAEKYDRADFVLVNDNEMEVIPQVLELHRRLLERTPTQSKQ